MTRRVDLLLVVVEGQSGDGFVVALHNSDGLGRVVDVQVVDEAAQGHAEQVPTLPQAGHLLVVDRRPHDELGHDSGGLDVPQSTSLVARAAEEASAVGGPGQAVDSALVRGTADLRKEGKAVSDGIASTGISDTGGILTSHLSSEEAPSYRNILPSKPADANTEPSGEYLTACTYRE